MLKQKSGLLLIFLVVSFITEVNADTVYLKNGRSLDGIIKKETDNSVELDIGFGTVGFKREEIDRVYKSTPSEIENIKQGWDKRRKDSFLKQAADNLKEESAPKQIDISSSNSIMVDAILNKSVHVSLLLDTGASMVVISESIASKLGLKNKITADRKIIQLILGDGRKVAARHVVMDSISVEGVEAKNVDVVVMEDTLGEKIGDGCLGMSFLNRFSFKIDVKSRRLILERS